MTTTEEFLISVSVGYIIGILILWFFLWLHDKRTKTEDFPGFRKPY